MQNLSMENISIHEIRKNLNKLLTIASNYETIDSPKKITKDNCIDIYIDVQKVLIQNKHNFFKDCMLEVFFFKAIM